MGLIREPKHVDFTGQSEPWTEQELADFRALMQKLKAQNGRRRSRSQSQKPGQQPSKQPKG